MSVPPDPSVAELVTRVAAVDPGRTALVSAPEGRSVSYRGLDQRTNRLANGLLGLGLRAGDRAACWLTTSIGYVETYLAAAKIGVGVVAVNERYVPEEAQYLVDDSECRVLLFDASTVERAAEVRIGSAGAGPSATRIGLDGAALGGSVSLDDLCAASSAPPSTGPGGDDVFALGYTSGTTGFPKGALLTHRSVRSIAASNAVAYHLELGSTTIFSGSMSFVSTVPAIFMSHFHVGGTVVMLGTRDPERVVDAVETYQATYGGVPPPMLTDYAEVFARNRHRIGSLRSVLQGAGKGDPNGLALLNDSLDGRLLIGWGMTENSGGLATVTSPADMRAAALRPKVLESAGRAVPGATVVLCDAGGAPVAHDGVSVGELVIATPSLAAGYLHPERYPTPAFRDGTYATGDLGSIDPDGTVYVHARRSDLIVSGGMNVYPSEVERVITELAGVVECAVVGFDHPRWGQAVGAAIVRAPGTVLTAGDVVRYVRGRLASYKKPNRIWFVPELPRTVGQKVHRQSLTELLERIPPETI